MRSLLSGITSCITKMKFREHSLTYVCNNPINLCLRLWCLLGGTPYFTNWLFQPFVLSRQWSPKLEHMFPGGSSKQWLKMDICRGTSQRIERTTANARNERRLAARDRFRLMHKTEREITAAISIQRVSHVRKIVSRSRGRRRAWTQARKVQVHMPAPFLQHEGILMKHFTPTFAHIRLRCSQNWLCCSRDKSKMLSKPSWNI